MAEKEVHDIHRKIQKFAENYKDEGTDFLKGLSLYFINLGVREYSTENHKLSFALQDVAVAIQTVIDMYEKDDSDFEKEES